MKRQIDKRILDPYIKHVVERCTFLYGLDSRVIKERMNRVQRLYISDEIKDTWFMCFDSGDNSILINPNYVNYDARNNRLVLDNSTKNAVISVFIHELVHVASTRSDAVGVRYFSGKDRVGLNEGLTQMFADDIAENEESKNFDGYYELKNVAKILRATFGPQVVVDSFFMGSKTLENGIINLSGNRAYYDELCNRMNALESLKEIKKRKNVPNNIRRQYDEYYSKTAMLLYKDVILNVVIPRLNLLKDFDKKNYIKKVINSVSGDTKTKNEIIALLSTYQGKSNQELLDEKYYLEIEREKNSITGDFINLVTSNRNYLNQFIARRDGTIIMLGNPNRVVDSEMARETVYSAIFDTKYGSLMTNNYLDTIYKQIVGGKPINIRGKDRLERLVIFSGIRKSMCSERGLILLNDPRELNDNESINPVVYVRRDEKYLSFDEARSICQKYGIYRPNKDKNNLAIDVLDKKTGIKVEDPYVHSISYMANNWMLALGITNATPKDIEKAFNPGNAVIFDDVMQALKRDYTEQGNTKRRFPTEYCVYESSKRIVEKFLSTPEKYEKVYEYFKYLGSSNYYQVFKGKSFNELNDSRYLEHQAEKAASRIVR